MTTTRLSKLFDRLEVWERIPLLIAAEGRGDEVEYRRLFDASPIQQWHFSEHLLAEQGLHTLTLMYITEQLDAAANYFLALHQLKGAKGLEEKDWILAAASSAHFFTVNAEAWRRFCTELGIAPKTLTAANYRGRLLSFLEEEMPEHVPAPEKLQAHLTKHHGDEIKLVTAETLLASWHNLLRSMNHHTPPLNGKKEA